ncbi:MAG TPA: hypothetical protein ACHBZA_05135 [Arsenophonus apicola]|uniref:hypothetical protein n=1 Tax=Arsenophonus TaxID=637 RepID=UPI0015D8C8AF|nr:MULTISPECIES: hypothetical protein [Arsenophonus]UBX30216.1 hypothetical protein LDL57_06325 [Arsenophonus apicola]
MKYTTNIGSPEALLNEINVLKMIITNLFYKLPENQRKEMVNEISAHIENSVVKNMLDNFKLVDK